MVIDAIVLPEVQGSAALDHQLVYVSTGQGQAQSLPKLLEREEKRCATNSLELKARIMLKDGVGDCLKT